MIRSQRSQPGFAAVALNHAPVRHHDVDRGLFAGWQRAGQMIPEGSLLDPPVDRTTADELSGLAIAVGKSCNPCDLQQSAERKTTTH